VKTKLQKRQEQYQEVEKLIQATDPKILLACADKCDGHSIFKHTMFVELGLDEKIVMYVAKKHNSMPGDPKGTIFSSQDGQALLHCFGVYALQLLTLIAGAFDDVQWEGALGRGTEAERIKEALHKKFSD
jgi:hypothetical protein